MKKSRIIFLLLFIFIVVYFLNSKYVMSTKVTPKKIVLEEKTIDNSYNNYKILQFSDLHYGNEITKDYLEKIRKEINNNKPDIILFTGDLINKKIKDEDKEILINFLTNLNSNYGNYAILGDKDYKDIEKVREIYQNSNFILLENNYDIIYNENNSKIFLGGLSSIKNNPDINKVMEYFNSNDNINYKIILVHEPDYTDDILINHKDINLILSGHSLLGQIKIPYYGGLIKKENAIKYNKDYYLIDNTKLYINNGLGNEKINIRINNNPNINLYVLKKI